MNTLGWSRETDIKEIAEAISQTSGILEKSIEDFELVALDAKEGDDVSARTLAALFQTLHELNIRQICLFAEKVSGLLLRLSELLILENKGGKEHTLSLASNLSSIITIFINASSSTYIQYDPSFDYTIV